VKTFNDFKPCFQWINSTIEKTTKEVIPEIAKEEYKDSEKYTYIDTQKMYDSGQQSDFDKGYVIIKAPQVRWLYYTSGIVARGNKNATLQWHETTKRENMNKYKNIYISNFKKKKG